MRGSAVPPWLWLSETIREGSPCQEMHPEVHEAISWLNEREFDYRVEWRTNAMPAVPGLCEAFRHIDFRIVFASDCDAVVFRLCHPKASQEGHQHGNAGG